MDNLFYIKVPTFIFIRGGEGRFFWHNPFSSPITVAQGKTFDWFQENNNQRVRYEREVKGLGYCTKIEGLSKDHVLFWKRATLKKVILSHNSIEHFHCTGECCTVQNVYWEDVCEDALTLKGSTNKGTKFYVKGGASKDGSDKIIQHNSARLLLSLIFMLKMLVNYILLVIIVKADIKINVILNLKM